MAATTDEIMTEVLAVKKLLKALLSDFQSLQRVVNKMADKKDAPEKAKVREDA